MNSSVGGQVGLVRVLEFDESGNARIRTHLVPRPSGVYLRPKRTAGNNKAGALQSEQIRHDNGQERNFSGPTYFEESNRAKSNVKANRAVEPARSEYFVQIGAFHNKANANRLQKQVTLSSNTVIQKTQLSQKSLYKVMIGPVKDRQKAKRIQKRIIRTDGLSAAFVVTVPAM